MSSPSRSDSPRDTPKQSSAPSIDLDLEEGVFRLLRSWWRRLAPKPAVEEADPREVRLEDHAGALRVLAQVIAVAPVRIQPARDVGGARGLDILLPSRIALGPTPEANRSFLVVRTAISAAIYRLDLTEGIETEPPLRVLESLRVARLAVDWLRDAFPGFADRHREAAALCLAARPDPASLEGRERLLEQARRSALAGEEPWLDDALRAELLASPPAKRKSARSPGIPLWGELVASPGRDVGAAIDESKADEEELPPAQDATELEAPPVDDVLRIELDEKEKEDAVLIHTFEKVETADEYAGGARDTDGADELADQLEALEEVDLRDLLRGGEQAHSLLTSNIQLDTDVPQVGQTEPDEVGIAYDEWDAGRGAYRKEWCTVYPTPFRPSRPGWVRSARESHHGLIHDLRRRLAIHRSRLQAIDRQPDGEDIDLRSVVEEHAAQRAGHGGNPRLYTRRAKRRRDFATTVLLDLSLSSDSWVDGERVLDVARDAVFVLGEVTDGFDDRIQVLAFASHTRNHCRVWEICGWQDEWSVGAARLGALEPQGYTRIGPALRHATAELAAQPADSRLLLLVSDGKPTDYDRYEGRYGIADVRQALREAARLDISTHALAVDRVGFDYLPAMFGPGGWHVLPHPNRLPEVLTTVYGRLTGV